MVLSPSIIASKPANELMRSHETSSSGAGTIVAASRATARYWSRSPPCQAAMLASVSSSIALAGSSGSDLARGVDEHRDDIRRVGRCESPRARALAQARPAESGRERAGTPGSPVRQPARLGPRGSGCAPRARAARLDWRHRAKVRRPARGLAQRQCAPLVPRHARLHRRALGRHRRHSRGRPTPDARRGDRRARDRRQARRRGRGARRGARPR